MANGSTEMRTPKLGREIKFVPRHSHGEAFCLMKYRTPRPPEHEELVWNSRDGVTPFVIASHDGRQMNHVEREYDVYAPLYVPPVGSRIFVDATPELARPIAVEWVERDWSSEEYPMSARFASKQEAVEFLVNDWTEATEHNGKSCGQPWLLSVTEEIHRQFKERAEWKLAAGGPQR